MRGRLNPVESLVVLPRLMEDVERRASWRQAIAALGHGGRVTGPPPLDGVDLQDVERAVGVALATGLVDDLDFIAPGPAAVALYELMAALPAGRDRRELGRRVFSRLYEGTAQTFASVATRMALGNARSLDTPTLRARIGLVMDLPIGTPVNADALALTIVTRRELCERWVARASTGALPARRLAAQLLEHAAREAAMRSLQGDPVARDLLTHGQARESYLRLLADREPLVWRHAAVARGLLASVDDHFQSEIELALDPALTPTEWRRAAVSLVAGLASDPKHGIKQCKALLDSDVARKDPGIFSTMVWGLPRVIEEDPDAAEELLDRLSTTRRADVAEAVALLLQDVATPQFGIRAAGTLRAVLGSRAQHESGAQLAQTERALRALEGGSHEEDVVHVLVHEALRAYEATGARAAHVVAVRAAEAAERAMHQIEVLGQLGESVEPELLELLADLDGAALERTRLADMLLLGRKPGEADASVPELERVQERLGTWILSAEEGTVARDEGASSSLVHRHRLRCLLHLVDSETIQRGEADELGPRLRARVRRTLRALLMQLGAAPPPGIHRILCATLARAFEAAVREGVAEPSELVLLLARFVSESESVAAIHEASTNPEVAEAIGAYATFVAAAQAPRGELESIIDPGLDSGAPGDDEPSLASRVVRLSRGLGGGGSYRGEALRQVVLRLGRALEMVAGARGLAELVDSGGGGTDPVADLQLAAQDLRSLTSRALRRVLEDDATPIAVVADVPPLTALVERAVSAGVPANKHQMGMAVGELCADLPDSLAEAIRRVVARIDGLPLEPASDVFAIPLEKRRAALPDWLLPRRTLGAFYVVRALGSGGTSSVFVARRIEERNEGRAESFALKVPEYDPSTARSLSEQEFLQLFREEAGALLSLPQHPNLARFVTFDLAARPKPILVMELIKGFSLDRLVRSRSLTLDRCLNLLDGILAGLDAMHVASVGHLDVKPSNVILRDNHMPVLVDFGLSGRQLRPGCGTLEYCAPEVLGVVPDGHVPQPMAADLYAFAATAFELLCGEQLFEAEDELTLMSAQVGHDGWPDKLRVLAATPEYADLAVVLAACLRRDPRDRPTASETRPALRDAGAALRAHAWPLRLHGDAPQSAAG